MDDWVLLVGGIVLLLATLAALLGYSGLFESVNVKTGKPPIGKAYVAYKDGTGPYSGVGSNFSESTSIGPTLKQIGIYYDDPAQVAEEKYRWAVGAVLAENDDPIDETLRLAYEKQKYKFITLPAVENSVTCIFPYATMISILIAVKRVYPKLGDYIRQYSLQAYPMIEVYFGGNIHFMAPLSNQMEFFTPKAMESETDQAEVEADINVDTVEDVQGVVDVGVKEEGSLEKNDEPEISLVEDLKGVGEQKGETVEQKDEMTEQKDETMEQKSETMELEDEKCEESSDKEASETENELSKPEGTSDQAAAKADEKGSGKEATKTKESPDEAGKSETKDVEDIKAGGNGTDSDDSFEKIEAEN